MEHHRAVQWSEKEYITLANLVQTNSDVLRKDLKGGVIVSSKGANSAKADVYFFDYCGFLVPEACIHASDVRDRILGR